MRKSPQARFLLGVPLCFVLTAFSAYSQQPAEAKKPAEVVTSTHYPILLLAQGALPTPALIGSAPPPTQASEPPWSLRIGQKGPERLDRAGYPPIPLDPGSVVREGTAESWTYNARDSQTGAAVAIHITREPCSDPALTTKFVFSASVEHAQLGSMKGCARVATEIFPKLKNQSDDDEDDPDAKPTPPPPTVTHFKVPTAVAYINASGRMVIRRGSVVRTVPGKPGYSLCLSHDGRKLLFTRDEQPSPLRTINEYDYSTGTTKELIRANAYQPFWSPDDTRIAFLENVEGKWQIWSMPAGAPEKAAVLYPGDATSLYGWADAHTLLASDLQSLMWIGDDGAVKQTLSSAELYGKDQFVVSSANTVRIHPLNPDLLLVSAELLPHPPAAGSKGSASPAPQPGEGFFLYEIRSRRRVLISPPDLTSNFAEWSRDGLQIYFTGRAPSSNAMTIYRVFWDGTSQTKYQDGYGLVIGE